MTPSTTTLLDAIAQGVVIVDASGTACRIVHANSAFLQLSGFKLPEIAGLDALAFFGQRTDHRSSQSLREALRASEPVSIEILLAPKTSDAMQVRLHVRPLADAPGHMLLTFEDVTRFTQARESLRTSEARLQVAMDAGMLSMWEWNVERDEVCYNDYWKEALGVEPSELLKREELADRLMLPSDQPEVLEAFEQHFRGATPCFECEYELTAASGGRKWFAARADVVLRDSTGNALRVIGVLRDITRRKRELKMAADVQERWERAVRGTSDGMYEWNLLTGHVWYAERFRDIVGHADAEFPDTFQAFQNVLHPDDRALVLHKIRRHLENQIPLDVRCRVITDAGAVLWCRMRGQADRDAAGRPLRLSGSISDITAQIEAEEALGRSQDFYGTILDSLPLYVAYVDRDECVMYANQQFQRFFRAPLASTRGHSVREVIGERRYEVVGQSFAAALQGRMVESQGHFRDTDDRRIDLEGMFVPHFNESGEVQGCFVAARDVTERRQLEAELRQSQKMEAVGRLTGGIAHDFNNLLAVIVGNMQLLSRSLRDSPRLLRQAETSMKAAMRGAELTRRLLAFARQQVLEPRVVDLDSLIGGMYDLLRRSLTGDIEIRQVTAPDVWPVKIDPGQLENAILNLVINARDAMPQGGAIIISTRNEVIATPPSDAAAFSGEGPPQPGEYAVLEVLDTGEGMPPETLKRVFEPFFTTKDVGKGSGLGLPMVYGFVRQSGGHVRISSTVGKGTTVQLFLPRSPENIQRIAREAGVSPELPSGWETILVVEDNTEVRATAVDILSSLGYRVLEAANGYQALEQFMQHTDIALVFSDVMLPGGLPGPALVDKLRERRPGLKILMTSAFSESSILHRDMLDGTLQLLTKPYRVEDLARQVRAILDENEEMRSVPA